MTTYTGTAGLDVFVGADFADDQFYFDMATLAATDVIVGGASTDPSDGDTLYLASGTYGSALFAGVTGIDKIVLEGPTQLAIDSALISQGGVTGPNGSLLIVTSGFGDVIDASGATGNGLWVILTGGNDIVFGSEEDDVFGFHPFASGDTTIDGAGGNDDLYLDAPGHHVIDGGAGDHDDLYITGTDLWLDLEAAGSQLDVDGGVIEGEVAGFERIHALTTGDATMYGSSGNDEFFAGGGDDLLVGRDGNDGLWGSAGNDTFIGGEGDDAFLGQTGIDTADYTGEADMLDVDLERASYQAIGGAGVGFDTLVEIENVNGGRNDDIIAGDGLGNTLIGNRGDDTLIGRGGDDLLKGGRGHDVLDGGIGDDILSGNQGDDTLDGGLGTDRLYGGQGFDIADYADATGVVLIDLAAGTANEALLRNHDLFGIEGAIGGSAVDIMDGDQGDNRFEGRQGNDILRGLGGDDILDGGDQDDRLEGGSGDDTLTGGQGADTYVFSDTGAGHGADVVADWEDGVDSIEFYGVTSVTVVDVGADASIEMYDLAGALIDTVWLTGAAGEIDASDYVLL